MTRVDNYNLTDKAQFVGTCLLIAFVALVASVTVIVGIAMTR